MKMRLKRSICIVSLAVGIMPALRPVYAAGAPSAKTMTADFVETTVQKTGDAPVGEASVVKGTLYFQHPMAVTLVINTPVNQWVIFGQKQTVIYYPDAQRAFQSPSEDPSANPYTLLFSGVLDGDLGLSKAGMKLTRKEAANGRLILHWAPPSRGGKPAGEFVAEIVDDRLDSFSIRDSKGKVLARNSFSNYVKHKAFAFPLKFESTITTGTTTTTKTITFADPRFDVALPDGVEHFAIPTGVESK